MAKSQLIPSGNKHVMLDGAGREYYRKEDGEWAPGYYDGRRFKWLRTRKFAARHRDLLTSEGIVQSFRLCRYTYKEKLRPAYAPVGKTGRQYARAYQVTQCDLWYRGGRFFAAYDEAEEQEGTYSNRVRPFSGTAWDSAPDQSERAGIPAARLTIEDGYIVAVEIEGEEMGVSAHEREAVAALLQIKDVEREARQPAPTTPTEEAAPVEEMEAARLTWIESTTCTGQQLDLVAYFGYGDSTWQDLAAPAA